MVTCCISIDVPGIQGRWEKHGRRGIAMDRYLGSFKLNNQRNSNYSIKYRRILIHLFITFYSTRPTSQSMPTLDILIEGLIIFGHMKPGLFSAVNADGIKR